MGAPPDRCCHGAPAFETKDEEETYAQALETLVSHVKKYLDRNSNSAGKKAADKFKTEFPHLITLEMIHLLAAEGTKMWLTDCSSRQKLVMQGLAEVIGKLEEDLKGFSTSKSELNKSFNASSGLKETTSKNLKKFFSARIPCTCLRSSKETSKGHEMGTCCAQDCGKRKRLKLLHACAACESVLYCCVECQRSDWPLHSHDCQRLAKARKEHRVLDIPTSDQVDESKSSYAQDDDEVSLVPSDLEESDGNIGLSNAGSVESLSFDDLIGEIEDLLGESHAHIQEEEKKRRTSSSKKMSSSQSKLHASTSLVPSNIEIEKKRRKDKARSSSEKYHSSSRSKLPLSMSFSIVEEKRRRKKKIVI